ncbi:hypothetical protein [Nocardiopsis suaedae]|uniref:Uncharacterized protein n=1 Tax=Nocardiopsis suaedae TaxID=3018444 RepID=A0ABT4TQZ4_9ACTN|nr:hypothetical protein [Nocardiopsis suaedae]MDA2807116.1 hypothetical protein [Nocardiopsis suaedae]
MRAARTLAASGLPACWGRVYAAMRDRPALRRAVVHTGGSLDRMPRAYRWGTAAALAAFPAAFFAATGRGPRRATPEQTRSGLRRLRSVPGYGQVLRATTALALYGALDGGAP